MENIKNTTRTLREEKQKRKDEPHLATAFGYLDDQRLEYFIKSFEKKLHQAHPLYSLL